jgi:hypothetical protein
MAWYPGAVKMELQPESDAQAAIVPTQFIMHSIAAPWTEQRIYEYWRDSTNLESHFGLAYDGDLGQFIGTQTRADANYAANLRSDGTGAVSIETASNLEHTDPWTGEQIAALVKLGAWLHEQHGIPLRICGTAADPGYGYHRLHAEWSLGGTACPGDARVKQFTERVFPGIVALTTGKTTPTEDDVSLTTAQAQQLADVLAAIKAVKTATVDKTLVTRASDSGVAYSMGQHVAATNGWVAEIKTTVAALQAVIAQLATALAAHDEQIDADALIARITAAIEQVTVRLDVPNA